MIREGTFLGMRARNFGLQKRIWQEICRLSWVLLNQMGSCAVLSFVLLKINREITATLEVFMCI